jgi:hypothetical protein
LYYQAQRSAIRLKLVNPLSDTADLGLQVGDVVDGHGDRLSEGVALHPSEVDHGCQQDLRAAQTVALRKGDWRVDTLALGQGQELVRREHYAAGSANTATFRHGIFRRHEWPFNPLGVALWIPPTRTAAEATWPEWKRVLALSRFVLDASVPKNGASFLLARSVRLIKQAREWDCLVTYADEWQGHLGTMYLAAGWEYVGKTRPERVYVRDGVMIARKAGPKTRTHAEMIALGAECVGSFAKHKFRKVLRPAVAARRG